MSTLLNVVIVIARCTRQHLSYGIRIEEKHASAWEATWAFALKEDSAQRQGYGARTISGGVDLRAGYPGCPHCGNASFFKCSCGKIACWAPGESRATCPWCRTQSTLSGQITGLNVGVDR